jgi:release factor glutamine methyltransferase
LTVDEALRCGLERTDAQALLTHVLGVSRAWLISHRDDPIPAAQLIQFESLVARRGAGEPIAYLVGQRDFFSRRFFCGPEALVPRPETELLVEHALRLGDAANIHAPLRVLDLGCGTGCIGLTLACERTHWHITLTDLSAEALALTQKNAAALCVAPQVCFVQSDWFTLLTGQTFQLIVSNPPYIAGDDAHLRGDGLRFEPRMALTDGADGLSVYRHLAKTAGDYLTGSGTLAIEHGYDQGAAVRALFNGYAHWHNVITCQDLAGHERITLATKAPGNTSTPSDQP